MDRLLKGGTLIDAAGRRLADVLIRDGRIAAIGPDIVEASGAQVQNFLSSWATVSCSF